MRAVYHVRKPGYEDRGLRPLRILLDALFLIGFFIVLLFTVWMLGGAPLPGYPG